jgi:hypothetical protein
MVVKIKYPSGTVIKFMWIKGKYGYIRTKNKVYRYPLPAEKRIQVLTGREVM